MKIIILANDQGKELEEKRELINKHKKNKNNTLMNKKKSNFVSLDLVKSQVSKGFKESETKKFDLNKAKNSGIIEIKDKKTSFIELDKENNKSEENILLNKINQKSNII